MRTEDTAILFTTGNPKKVPKVKKNIKDVIAGKVAAPKPPVPSKPKKKAGKKK
jgi:hypothetical protein